MFRHRLAREVAVVVFVKTLLVVIASLVVFAPARRPSITAQSVASHLALTASDADGDRTPAASPR